MSQKHSIRDILNKVYPSDNFEISSLYDEVNRISARRAHEYELRRNNPSVKEAWERYRVILNLAMEDI